MVEGIAITWPEKAAEIVEMYYRYLQSLGSDSDLEPTHDNARIIADTVLIPAWHRREPILFGYLFGRIIAATFTTLPADGLQYRVPTAFGHGTWVDPEFRGRGVAGQMIKGVRGLLRLRGYSRQAGMANVSNGASLAAFKKMGFSPRGVILTAEI